MQVHQITAGLGFLAILSTNGYVYTMGDNNHGELGLGYGSSVAEPTMIESLEEKIIEISAGLKHTVARSSLGKIFTWGWG